MYYFKFVDSTLTVNLLSDRFMNVSLHDVTVQGNDDQHYHFEEFFVKARNIRYVQIPDDVRHNVVLNQFWVTLLQAFLLID